MSVLIRLSTIVIPLVVGFVGAHFVLDEPRLVKPLGIMWIGASLSALALLLILQCYLMFAEIQEFFISVSSFKVWLSSTSNLDLHFSMAILMCGMGLILRSSIDVF